MKNINIHLIDSDTDSDFVYSIESMVYTFIDLHANKEKRNLIFYSIPLSFEETLNPFVDKDDFFMFREIHNKIIERLFGKNIEIKQKAMGELKDTLVSMKNIYSSALSAESNKGNIFHLDDKKHSYAEACIMKFEIMLLSQFIVLYFHMNNIEVTPVDPRLFIRTKYSTDHLHSQISYEDTTILIKNIPEYIEGKRNVIFPVGYGSCVDTNHDTVTKKGPVLDLIYEIIEGKEVYCW